ncbi:V-type proton ATPase subunit e-like [Acropora muricata]|uniref:V-type proton ATPase subunit e-like n=1 Tax=Acropora muricata TaxID=159855 RepID=UPI0034E57E7B
MEIDGGAEAKAVYPVIVVTAIWVIVGGFIPFLIKGQNRRLIQTMLVLTAVCCWLFWVCAYFAQLNPLIGPEMLPEQLAAAAREWGGKNV